MSQKQHYNNCDSNQSKNNFTNQMINIMANKIDIIFGCKPFREVGISLLKEISQAFSLGFIKSRIFKFLKKGLRFHIVLQLLLTILLLNTAKADNYQEYLPENLKQRLAPYIEESKEYFGVEADMKSDQKQSRLLIFISSSMPRNILERYASDARKTGAIFVLRGFIEGDLAKTISFIKSLHDKGVGATISPHGFKQMNVVHVPTIALVSPNSGCYLSECDQTPLYDKISGSINLSYALRQIATEGDYSKKEAEIFLARLEGGNG